MARLGFQSDRSLGVRLKAGLKWKVEGEFCGAETRSFGFVGLEFQDCPLIEELVACPHSLESFGGRLGIDGYQARRDCQMQRKMSVCQAHSSACIYTAPAIMVMAIISC